MLTRREALQTGLLTLPLVILSRVGVSEQLPPIQPGENMDTGKLRATGTCVLDGSGNGQIFLQPDRAGLIWHITHMTTDGNSADEKVQLDVYRNAVTGQNLLDHSDKANADVSECDNEIGPGEFLIFQYILGTPGARMNCRVEGTFTR